MKLVNIAQASQISVLRGIADSPDSNSPSCLVKLPNSSPSPPLVIQTIVLYHLTSCRTSSNAIKAVVHVNISRIICSGKSISLGMCLLPLVVSTQASAVT